MKISVFGGTTEGRLLSQQLAADGMDVQVFVATKYGGEEQLYENSNLIKAENAKLPVVNIGRKTVEEIRESVRDSALCIDATHPYAKLITANIRRACEDETVPYYRVTRNRSSIEADYNNDSVIFFTSVSEAAEWLRETGGNILITTGTKELEAYTILDRQRLYPRVLPFHDSITACEDSGIPHRNIIAMQGPFSREMNIALIRQFDARFLVTKDSGINGGFEEKIKAVQECGITALVITRPEDEGVSVEEMYEICRRMI